MGKCIQKIALFIAVGLLSCCTTKVVKKEPLLRVAVPATVFGRDFYALQSSHWNVKNTNMYPMTPMATGNLDNTFGAELIHVDSMLSALQPVFHRVHIINTTCVRNGNCGSYEIGYGYNKQTFNNAIKAHNKKILNYVVNKTTLYKNLSTKYPNTKFVVSPALEHDLDHVAWNILADTVLSVWPDAQLANSPDAGISISLYKGAWLERHGKNFPLDADIVSLDGFDATDIDIETFRNRVVTAPHVKVALSWTAGDNCRVKQWIDPRQRTNCPSRQTFELVSHITEPLPGAPKFTGGECKRITPINNNDIWKPLAESYPTPDPRQELPVLITGAFKSSDVQLLASNGMPVGRVAFYGPYGKLSRWYSGYKTGSHLSGYEFQKKAVFLTGSPYVWLMQNGVCKGPFVPGRRAGNFR